MGGRRGRGPERLDDDRDGESGTKSSAFLVDEVPGAASSERGEKEHFWLTMKMRRILVNEHMERLYMMLGHAHS